MSFIKLGVQIHCYLTAVICAIGVLSMVNKSALSEMYLARRILKAGGAPVAPS